MGMSAAHCQGNVREFQSVWRVVTLCFIFVLCLCLPGVGCALDDVVMLSVRMSVRPSMLMMMISVY